MKYHSSPEIKEQHEKRYQENPKLHKKSGIGSVKKEKTVIRLRTFFGK